MTTTRESGQDRHWQAILWSLRATVVVQCIGNWRWMTQIEETPLLHWMLDPTDIGGLAWTESTALAVQQVVGWWVLFAAGWVLWRPRVVVLAPLVLLQVLIAVAMWQINDGYTLLVSWIPHSVLTLFPFATQLARIAAPLGLLLLISKDVNQSYSERRTAIAMQILRWSIAVVFLAHGLEAWLQNPLFLDLLISANQRLFGQSLSQKTAEQCLAAIGGVDILLAVACVAVRSQAIMWWMAFWGAVTSLSRLVAYGWVFSWHETFTRSSHLGIPLAVVLWWHLLKWREKELRTKH